MNSKVVFAVALIGLFCVVQIKSQGPPSPIPASLVAEVKPLVMKLLEDFENMSQTKKFEFPKLVAQFKAIAGKVAPVAAQAPPEIRAAVKDFQAKIQALKPGKINQAQIENVLDALEKIGSLVMPPQSLPPPPPQP